MRTQNEGAWDWRPGSVAAAMAGLALAGVLTAGARDELAAGDGFTAAALAVTAAVAIGVVAGTSELPGLRRVVRRWGWAAARGAFIAVVMACVLAKTGLDLLDPADGVRVLMMVGATVVALLASYPRR